MRLLVALFVLPVIGAAEIINFDSAQPGSVPSGWTVAMTHAGGAPKWQVLNDPSAPSKPNVLAQASSDPTDGRFPFTVYFNSDKLFDVEDSTFQTAGKVGLWTKADSVIYFDDFEVIEK
jgi:hypothetical protein